MPSLRYMSSDKDTHFTGALAQNAIEHESINMPADYVTTGKQRVMISELNFQSDQNLDWEVIFWSTSDFSDTNLDLDKIITRIPIPASTGERVAGAGQYYYENPMVQSIEYLDEDNTSKVHVSLVNRDGVAKNAGATGEVKLRLGISTNY